MSSADLRDACWQRGIRVWQLGRRYWIAADDVERLLTPWTPEPAVTGERFADRVERAAGIPPPRARSSQRRADTSESSRGSDVRATS